jgi:hypothetical protein
VAVSGLVPRSRAPANDTDAASLLPGRHQQAIGAVDAQGRTVREAAPASNHRARQQGQMVLISEF